ncbi:MAG: restriction endonuclease, SacI family [Nitrospirae bacterium]|nr:restriction endonuclease, SacI family [Nitrospirota bacterium]
MAKRAKPPFTLDHSKAQLILEDHWKTIGQEAAANPNLAYLSDPALLEAIRSSLNHKQVAYRFCLPIQLLGKLADPAIDCLRLQRKKGSKRDVGGWDARSLGSKVVAPFNQRQEGVLGSSADPYVGNPMRIPRMRRDDPSKKDIAGWNVLVGVLEEVESKNDPELTVKVFRQVLLEVFRCQQALRFAFPLPPRISLEDTLVLADQFLREKSGGDRALALCGALFDTIGLHFGLFKSVNRARINASDEAIGQAADLECMDENGNVALAVEVKDRFLSLTDVEGTIRKSRRREIREVFFATPSVLLADQDAVKERVQKTFAAGQNLYVFDFFQLARSVLALGGEAARITFIKCVGEHLNRWNTQPAHRQSWKKLLDSV